MSLFPNKRRIKAVRDKLLATGSSALVISSAPAKARNRDSVYPYRQDSDFYYLTGIKDPGYALIISTAQKTPILLAPPVDPVRVLWDGPLPSVKKLAEEIGAEAKETKDIGSELKSLLKGTETLYFQNTPGTVGWAVASELQSLPPHRRGTMPARFAHLDTVLAEMRLYKDQAEVEAIRMAARITNAALYGSLSLIQPDASEQEIAGVIEFYFKSYGAVPAFNSIVATGPSAATLHHEHLVGKLKRGHLLLLDIGAEFELYAGDVTRVLPVGGVFDERQRRLYNVVLAAQLAAIKKVRSGVTMAAVQDAAAAVITDGLIDLKLLKGRRSKLMKTKAYKKFFPHSIGHPLGLDVHDVTGATTPLVLKKGMVVTIEPGIYLPKRIGKFAPCGIRIEDDVLVTSGKAEVLSEGFPKDVDEIEALFS